MIALLEFFVCDGLKFDRVCIPYNTPFSYPETLIARFKAALRYFADINPHYIFRILNEF